jgi:hypothetical protein
MRRHHPGYCVDVSPIANGVRLRLSPQGSKRLAATDGDRVVVTTPDGDTAIGRWRDGAIELDGIGEWAFEDIESIRVRKVQP